MRRRNLCQLFLPHVAGRFVWRAWERAGKLFPTKKSSRCFVAHLRFRPRGEGGTPIMKGAGMLVGNFELNA